MTSYSFLKTLATSRPKRPLGPVMAIGKFEFTPLDFILMSCVNLLTAMGYLQSQ